jgi:hypothetical protein
MEFVFSLFSSCFFLLSDMLKIFTLHVMLNKKNILAFFDSEYLNI